jgi:Second Messenger Oligonucleotide or Dinucleotide Synthetase domain
MAKTLDEAFRTFHSWLTPTAGETAAAKRHRASIEACLKSNFEITRFFRTGSFGNGTSIRGYSDVDYFASIPNKYLTQNSDSTLKKVWRALDNRFPDTGIGIRTPAVWVPFGDDNSESTDVVPAEYMGKKDDGYMIYDIADRSGGWMKTSPDAHTAYVSDINDNLNSKLKPLIRFAKAWKYYKRVPLYSFYLEMKIARYASEESSIIYSIDLKRIFRLLANEELSAMQDPTGVSGYIYPCFSDAMKDDALSKIETALSRAEKACDAENDDEIKDAFYWWDLLFDGEFPSYG